jgi:hypothetical protein
VIVKRNVAVNLVNKGKVEADVYDTKRVEEIAFCGDKVEDLEGAL